MTQNSKTEEENKLTNENKKDSGEYIPSPVDSPSDPIYKSSDTPNRDGKHCQKNQKPTKIEVVNDRKSFWVMLATIVIAIATLINVGIAYFQWSKMSGQLKQMQEASGQTDKIIEITDKQTNDARLGDRAFISFSNPTLRDFPKYIPPHMTINITARNTGNVPARNVSIDYACLIVERSKNITDPFEIAEFQKKEIPQFIGPNQSVGFAVMDVERDTFMDRMLKEGIKVYIVVKTEYLDGFNRKRTTQMSRQFQVDSARLHSFSFAGPHNCIDEDCPD